MDRSLNRCLHRMRTFRWDQENYNVRTGIYPPHVASAATVGSTSSGVLDPFLKQTNCLTATRRGACENLAALRFRRALLRNWVHVHHNQSDRGGSVHRDYQPMLTGTAFFMKAGSTLTPKPGPSGQRTFPFSHLRDDVAH